MGQHEDPLTTADNLIAAQRYNEAITFLAEFIKKNPNRFDEAQSRIRVVIAKRDVYNKTADELLNVLVNEPDNQDKKVALTRLLEQLDPYPNKFTQDFVLKTKLASLFFVNRALFNRIMEQGRALIDAGKYAEATKKYEEGYILYWPEFQESGYDDFTVKSVTDLVNGVKARIAEFDAAQPALVGSVERLEAAFTAGDPAAVEAAYRETEQLLIDQARRRDVAVRAGRLMTRQFQVLQKSDPTLSNDSSFLPMAYRLTLGRASETKLEGVTGAMDSEWQALLDGIQGAAEPSIDKIYGQGEAAYDQGRWKEAEDDFDRAGRLAVPAMSSIGLWSLVSGTDMAPIMSAYGKSVLAPKSEAYERLRHLHGVALASSRLAGYEADVAAADSGAETFAASLTGEAPLAPSLATLAGHRMTIQGIETKLEGERSASKDLAEDLARWTSAGLGDERAAKNQGAYDGRLAAAIESARSYEVAVVARAGGFEYGNIEKDYGAQAQAVDQGRVLLEGEASTDPALGGALLRYPTRSADILGGEDQAIRSLRGRIAIFMGRLQKELPYVASDASVQAWVEKARQLDRQAVALESTRVSLLGRALDERRQAEAAHIEADRLLGLARAALAKENFDGARRNLDSSRGQYLASLSLENDPKLRSDSDQSLQQLGDEIIRAENDAVVRDTRALITQGKGLYFQGLFNRAEDALLSARERWKTTHRFDPTSAEDDSKNPEVEYWLRLVQTALSVKTGRDIPPTAPLYPEMSQTLSLAMQYFAEGQKLIASGRKVKDTDVQRAFALSRAKIQEVMTVFPLNQQAGVLSLKIDQLTDPDLFRQGFGQKLADDQKLLDTDPQKAYSDLQNLAAIQPNFPGIKAAIDRAEIRLGIRLPPPDPAKMQAANQLVAAARRIFDSGNRDQFPFAIAQLDQALQNDPNNEAAAALKDRLQTFQGGSAQIVLSSAAEEQYQQAVTFFQNGDNLSAFQVVQRLLADPKNKKVQQLLDLYGKIQARL